MSARLTERTQASSTLAGQLMQARMEGGDREARFRAELEEERDKLIKVHCIYCIVFGLYIIVSTCMYSPLSSP